MDNEIRPSDLTASSIQAVLDANDWSYTDHATDIVCDHADINIDLDPLFEIRHRNNVWRLLVKNILRDILPHVQFCTPPSLMEVYRMVEEEMVRRTSTPK